MVNTASRVSFFRLALMSMLISLCIANPRTATAGTKRIAVLDFDDASLAQQPLQAADPVAMIMALRGMAAPEKEKSKVGQNVSNLLVTELVKDGTFRVVERSQLQNILKEQKLADSGALDPSDAAKAGKVLGVNAVVMGSVTQFTVDSQKHGMFGIGVTTNTAKVSLTARLIDASTGEVIFVAEGSGEEENSGVSVGDIYKSSNQNFQNSLLGTATQKALVGILDQIKDQAPKFKESVLTGAVAYYDEKDKSCILDFGKGSGIEKGQKLFVLKVVKEIKSPSTGEVIKRITDSIAEVEVTDVDSGSCTAKCVSGKCAEIKEKDIVKNSRT